MRGKVSTLVLHRPDAISYDDLGRRTVVPGAGVEVEGSVSSPQLVEQGQGVRVDLVARIDSDHALAVEPDTWLEITESPNPLHIGEYDIETLGGGRRVIRLGLIRRVLRDG